MIAAVVSAIYTAIGYHTREQNMSKAEARAASLKPPFTRRQLLVGALFPVIAWTAVIFDFADRHFLAPLATDIILDYGWIDQTTLYLSADGNKLSRFADYDKVLFIARGAFVNVDEMTDPVLAKSELYTITPQIFKLGITRPKLRINPGQLNQIAFYLVVLPNGFSPDQIRTLADIRQLGGQIVDRRGQSLSLGSMQAPPPAQNP